MKRFLVSVSGGVAVTFTALFVGALFSNYDFRDRLLDLLLFGPASMLERFGVFPNCANANSVAEKLSCIRLYLLVDLVWYPFVIGLFSLAIHSLLFRGRKTLAPGGFRIS